MVPPYQATLEAEIYFCRLGVLVQEGFNLGLRGRENSLVVVFTHFWSYSYECLKEKKTNALFS